MVKRQKKSVMILNNLRKHMISYLVLLSQE